jgi:hypothetical protein
MSSIPNPKERQRIIMPSNKRAKPAATEVEQVTNLGATVDALGTLKARIADLMIQERELKESIADLPEGSYEGKRYRLTIAECTRSGLDMDAVRAHLSPQFIAAHTTYTPYRRTTVVARTGKGLTPAIEAA